MNPKKNSQKLAKSGFLPVIYNRYFYFLLGGIALFYLINNYIWLKLNVYAYGPDEFSHLFFFRDFYNAIASGQAKHLVELFKASTGIIWPPLFHFTAAVLCFVSGTSSFPALIINLLCLLILLFSVYSIGCGLYGKETGILAVLFLSLYPMVFRYSRFFGLDFVQLSVLSLSVYLLMRTEYFSDRKASLLFGISIGAGLLIKWAFALFLAGPLLCVFLYAVFFKKDADIDLRQVCRNLFFSLLAGGLIASVWYLPSYLAINMRMKMFLRSVVHYPAAYTSLHNIPAVFELSRLFEYLRLLINEQASFLFSLVFIATAPFFLRKSHNRIFVISWYILPYAILSLSFQKEGRFMLSSLPAIALISAAGLQEMFRHFRIKHVLKHALLALLLFLGALQFFDVSYNYGRQNKTFSFITPVGRLHIFTYPTTEQHGWVVYGPPFRKDWKIDKIAASISGHSRNELNEGAPVLVGLLEEDDYVKQVFDFPKVLDYQLAIQGPGKPFAVINFLPVPKQDDWSFMGQIDNLDYLIFVSGVNDWPEFDNFRVALYRFKSKRFSLMNLSRDLYNRGESYDFNSAYEKLGNFLNNKKAFSLIDKIDLPDGYFAYIYARSSGDKHNTGR